MELGPEHEGCVEIEKMEQAEVSWVERTLSRALRETCWSGWRAWWGRGLSRISWRDGVRTHGEGCYKPNGRMNVTLAECCWAYFSKTSPWKSVLYFLKGFWSSLEFFCPFLDQKGKTIRCWIIISWKWPGRIRYSQDRSTCLCLRFSSRQWTIWIYHWIVLNELFTVHHCSHLQNRQVIVSWGKMTNSNWHGASVSGSQEGEAGIVLD